jgi:hypothetical protein
VRGRGVVRFRDLEMVERRRRYSCRNGENEIPDEAIRNLCCCMSLFPTKAIGIGKPAFEVKKSPDGFGLADCRASFLFLADSSDSISHVSFVC